MTFGSSVVTSRSAALTTLTDANSAAATTTDLRMTLSLAIKPSLTRGSVPRVFARTWVLFGRRAFALVTRTRSFAEDHHDRLFAARTRAVVMHFAPRMHDERARLDRHRALLRIPRRAGIRPPRARDHHDV